MNRRWRNLPPRRGKFFPAYPLAVAPSIPTVIPDYIQSDVTRYRGRIARRGDFFGFVPTVIVIAPKFVEYGRRSRGIRLTGALRREGQYFYVPLSNTPPVGFASHRGARGYVVRRGDFFGFIPTTVITAPNFVEFRSSKRAKFVVRRDGNYFSVVPAQVVVATPNFVEFNKRRRSNGLIRRDGAVFGPVPAPQAVPATSNYVDFARRVRVNSPGIRRRTQWKIVVNSAVVPYGITSRRARAAVTRRGDYFYVPQVVVASTNVVGFVVSRRSKLAVVKHGKYFAFVPAASNTSTGPLVVYRGQWRNRVFTLARRGDVFGYPVYSAQQPPGPTPPERTHIVPTENRTFVVEPENRTFVVPGENRVF